MWNQTAVSELLKIDYPILQAGMAGGPAGARLAAAVSEAGGLGTLGAGYMKPGEIREAVREIRRLTDKPFAVNLFIPEPYEEEDGTMERARRLLQPYCRELGLAGEGPAAAKPYAEPFEEQAQVLLEEKVPVFSFTFGVPSADWIDAFKKEGILLIGTATTVAEGAHLESEGIDLVVGQGSEAGGHRGTFLGGHEQALVGTMALIPQLADTLHVPVIAAGGIMDGRGIAASLLLGASGVQLGTAFLASPESGAHPRYKEAVLQSMEESTVVTRAFSGKAARGIRNRFVVEMEQAEAALPPYPVQNALTRELRREAARQERIEFMSLWAGQGSRLATDVPAGVRVRELAAQTEEAFRRMHF